MSVRAELEKKFKETGKIDTSKLNSSEPIEAPTEVSINPDKYKDDEIVTLIPNAMSCYEMF